jgi:hypothetical protein
MLALVLFSLALGIAATIGIVAVFAIIARAIMGVALAHRLPQLDRGARVQQGIAAVAIIAIGVYTLMTPGA